MTARLINGQTIEYDRVDTFPTSTDADGPVTYVFYRGRIGMVASHTSTDVAVLEVKE